ncbi:hypothetical protein BBW65_06020 [Helicobacter enhydrae]|uniref:DUF7494 domain-containing protein n=1 Tax=Helicobacter enhydrae TaxID=222136 RepID=A0A1B1U6J1_9HELI|nr:hypothetical protein [Helicobacter enhydrae]ANV98378.1 hypothetical protein BBW65_06020 [Helicobacter enhydrae]
MRFLLVLCICLQMIFALDVQINFGKEKGEEFAVLNLAHTKPFECREEIDVYNKVTKVVCVINQTPFNNFIPTGTAFFDFATHIKDSKLYLDIIPKKNAKLFMTFLDLKGGDPIPVERPKVSKRWQVVGYEKQIPFLSGKKGNGLNFPIKIASTQDIYTQQLDVNRQPLVYNEGLDYTYLLEIRKDYEKGKYQDVILGVNKALYGYPNSIFRKDFLLNKIKAIAHLKDQEDKNALITLCLEWLRDFPSDSAAPEVLYILANTYAQFHLNDEAIYYYRRIINEYVNTDWVALAEMRMAYYFSNVEGSNITPAMFAQAYKDAKTQSVANRIAITWAVFELEEGNAQKAQELFNLIFTQYPYYFLNHPQGSIAIAKTFAAAELYTEAGKLGAYLAEHLPKTSSEYLENLLDWTGEWFEEAGLVDEAHRYNAMFMQKFPDSKDYTKVQERDDALFFKLEDKMTPDEKLKKYDEIIAKYPDSNIATEALKRKADVLYELGKYDEILKLGLGQSEMVAKAQKALVLQALANKECKKIPSYLEEMDYAQFDQKERLEIFDCLYSLAFYQEAYKAIEGQIQKESQAPQKIPYLYRLAKVLNQLGRFAESKKASEDCLELSQALSDKKYKDVIFVLFDDLVKLGLNDSAQKVGLEAQKLFKNDKRLLEVDFALLKWASANKDYNQAQIYAQDLLRVQKVNQIADYTPLVNFMLIDLLNQQQQYQEAIKETQVLAEQKLKNADLQRVFYTQGSLYKALGDKNNAQKSFQKCLEPQGMSAWKDLCQKSLQLIE